MPGAVRKVFQGGSGAKNGQTIAILANGSVWSWGDNDRGQLGTPASSARMFPGRVDVPKGVNFVKVSPVALPVMPSTAPVASGPGVTTKVANFAWGVEWRNSPAPTYGNPSGPSVIDRAKRGGIRAPRGAIVTALGQQHNPVLLRCSISELRPVTTQGSQERWLSVRAS